MLCLIQPSTDQEKGASSTTLFRVLCSHIRRLPVLTAKHNYRQDMQHHAWQAKMTLPASAASKSRKSDSLESSTAGLPLANGHNSGTLPVIPAVSLYMGLKVKEA